MHTVPVPAHSQPYPPPPFLLSPRSRPTINQVVERLHEMLDPNYTSTTKEVESSKSVVRGLPPGASLALRGLKCCIQQALHLEA